MLRLVARGGRFTHDHTNTCSLRAKQPLNLTYQRSFASRRRVDHPEQQQSSPVIKWFNQFSPGSSRRKEIDPKLENADEDSPEARALRARIDQLEAEIADLNGENKPTLIEPLIATLTPEEQAKVRKALAEEDEEQDDLYENDISLMDLPKLAKLGPKLEIGPSQIVYLQNLDKCLRNAADDVSKPSTRDKLWSTYLACKRSLPPFLHLVPASVFRVLWESQMGIQESHRSPRVCMLARDIIDSGKELSGPQTLVHIDSLLRQGLLDDAYSRWLKEGTRLDDDDESRLEYRYLGVRLFADMDKPEKAQDIAMSLLPMEKDMMSSILIPVMIAWIKRDDESSFKNAWALYLRLRAELGTTMAVKDFDNIALTLISCGRTDMALAVFKDLMLSEQDTPETSDQIYHASVRLVEEMQRQSIDSKELSRVSLATLISTPRRFQNKYFYGSWIKHLIGKGEINAAGAVVELMMERGVKTDAKHMNGIIAAYFRNGGAPEKAKAEEMGWAMIAQRLDFIRARRGHPIDPSVEEETLRISRWPKHIRRFIALANAETFSILLMEFERSGRQKLAELLQRYFIEAELTPNSYYMNHLMYTQLRQANYRPAWAIFKSLSSYVTPDLQTFACLWDCEKGHLDRIKLMHSDKFPGPRAVLGEMISWYAKLSRRASDQARGESSRSLYDQIVRCMCLNRDLQGTIIALYALRDKFGMYPNQGTVRMITFQVAHVATGAPRTTSRARQKSAAYAMNQQNIAKMSELFRLIVAQRATTLKQRGVDPTQLSSEELEKELLTNVVIYLMTIMGQTCPSNTIQERIELAAQEVGLPEIGEEVKRLR